MHAPTTPYLWLLFWIQETPLGDWVRTSDWGAFGFLVAHTISMGMLAGTGMALAVRSLGIARGAPLQAFGPLLWLMAFAGLCAVVSGLCLVIAYPAKALTNPVFFAKLGLVAVAVFATTRLKIGKGEPGGLVPAESPHRRRWAALAIAAWVLAITAGRFLAYTYSILKLYA